jgi:soluble lytic murein transglycosylase-like protein
MRLNFLLGKQGATTILFGAVLAISMVCGKPMMAFATAEEDTGLDVSANAFKIKSAAEPIQISEATPAPFIAAQTSDLMRRKAGMVAGYIQTYNKRLAMDEIGNISQAIVQYSDRYGVDYRLLTSIIAIESAFRRDAISSSGAIGMGQLKPDTARWLGVLNPYDPVDNIAGTARFLSWLVKRYNGNLEYALSAYYQGPGSVDRNGITPVCMPYLEKVNRALGPLM